MLIVTGLVAIMLYLAWLVIWPCLVGAALLLLAGWVFDKCDAADRRAAAIPGDS